MSLRHHKGRRYDDGTIFFPGLGYTKLSKLPGDDECGIMFHAFAQKRPRKGSKCKCGKMTFDPSQTTYL